MVRLASSSRVLAQVGWCSLLLVCLILLAGCSRGRTAAEAERSPQAADEIAGSEAEAGAEERARAAEMARAGEAETARMAEASPDAVAPPLVMPRIGRADPELMLEAPAAAAPRSMEMPELPLIESPPPPGFAEAPSTLESFTAPLGGPAADELAPLEPAAELDLPAGSSRGDEGFATVQVFYATDRQRGALPLSSFEMTGRKRAFIALSGCSLLLIALGALSSFLGRIRTGAFCAVGGGVSAALAALLVVAGQTNIAKHGVTYTGDRGQLARGVCQVTVPDTHRRGMVERPSLLRFEFRESQQDHIVLTSAVELSEDVFQRQLAETVAGSPERDLLVFIHGYNVDFESAVRRTAQIAVDLPFEGVPVCYSWPSQGSLLGYSIDENNSQWTVTHLKQFLLELVEESGADSINVVAHSMGNRSLADAMQQIGWQVDPLAESPFDRLVLAAPDVDADHFRRDLAPALLQVANQVTLYASSDDQALIASKNVHGYPRAGESGENIVVVAGIETVDVSGIDLSLLGHSYYGDNESILRDLYDVIRARLPAPQRESLVARQRGSLVYWQLARGPGEPPLR